VASLGLAPGIAGAKDAAQVPAVRHPDAEVFLDLFGPRAQVRHVRNRLRRSAAVAKFAYLPERAARAELRRTFAHTPSVLAAAATYTVRRSFRVDFTKHADRTGFKRAMQRVDGVDHVTIGRKLSYDDRTVTQTERFELCQGHPDPDLEVFLHLDVSFEQQRAVRLALEQDPDVTGLRVVSPEEQRRTFECVFRRAFNPTVLPWTYQVTLRRGTDTDALRLRLDGLEGVDRALSNGPLPKLT
jgi:cell division protein FtsX